MPDTNRTPPKARANASTVVNLALPTKLLAACHDATRASCLRRWLQAGVQQTRIPALVQEKSQHVAFRLTEREHQRLQAWARIRGLSEELPLARLVRLAITAGAEAEGVDMAPVAQAAAAQWSPEAGEALMARLRDAGITPRDEQQLMAGLLAEARTSGKIAMLEAATGSGKTLAYAAQAVDAAADGARVVLAVPTLSLVREAANQIQTVAKPTGIGVAAICGRPEFVSEHALAQWLDVQPDSEQIQAARAWMNRQHMDGWRTDDLLTVAPDIAPDEVALLPGADDDEDAGYRAYRRQFEVLPDQGLRILVVTHAMLALHLDSQLRGYYRAIEDSPPPSQGDTWLEKAHDRIQWLQRQLDAPPEGLLPWLPDVCIVDEAHLFAERLCAALSSQASIPAILRRIETIRAHSSSEVSRRIAHVPPALKEHADAIDRLGRSTGYEGISLRDPEHESARFAIGEIRALLQDVQSATRRVRDPVARREADRIKNDTAVLRSAEATLRRGQGLQSVTLDYSPRRHHASVAVSRRSAPDHLALLWGGVQSGAVVSATLYELQLAGLSANYMGALLNIPAARRLTQPAPIVPPWLRDGVAVHQVQITPGAAATSHFYPPAKAQGKAHKRWTITLAAAIEQAAEDAHGGMIVYCTSYQAAEAIADWLSVTAINERLIVSRAGQSASQYTSLRAQFLVRGARGERPIWLATPRIQQGEGFTLADVAPEDDYGFTDLVVTRLPFALQSPSQQRYYEAEMQMVFAFRQLAGRLIRGPGYRERRLWLLDPRGVDYASHAYAARIQAVLREYRTIEALPYDAQRTTRLLRLHQERARPEGADS